MNLLNLLIILQNMDEKTIAVIVGALIGIIPTMISKYVDSRREEKKWLREKEFSSVEKFKTQLGITGKKLLKIQHSVNWICWIAAKSPEKITVEQIENYDSEVRQLFPEVLAELVGISIVDNYAYEKLNLEFDKIVKIDSTFSKIINENTQQNQISIEDGTKLEALFDQIVSIRIGILQAIKDIITTKR